MDLAEIKAHELPIIIWRFCSYKSEEDYNNGNHYFTKDFVKHHKMKNFSAKHSVKQKQIYPEYCSMYWKIEIKA